MNRSLYTFKLLTNGSATVSLHSTYSPPRRGHPPAHRAPNQGRKTKVISNRKAQMEIIGLVVIVILITLGMLFMAQFALLNKPQSAIFLRKEVAASGLSALVKTTVKPGVCPDNVQLQLSEVLIDCARHFPPGLGDSTFNCNNQHSCPFFRETAKSLLDQSIGIWQRGYELQIRLIRAPGSNPELLFDPIQGKGGCPPTKNRDSSGSFPLPTVDAGLIEAVLYVCD
ncbi:hypothetical protein J4479_00070 [Candidatus Woesearchaeota archaeon]|nr:hypothetical protein [Candidatus Woesearchaeota archaeon]